TSTVGHWRRHRGQSRRPTDTPRPLPATGAAGRWRSCAGAVFSALAGHAVATNDELDPRSSHVHGAPVRPGCADNRTGILSRQLTHDADGGRVALDQARLITQRGSSNGHQRARSSDRYAPSVGVSNLTPTRRRAYHFFPLISFITSISRSRSANSFFSRAFSVSIWRSRFTSTASSLPKRLRQA